MTKNYVINFDTHTINCTASFMKKAGTYGSAEYRELMGLRHDLPEFTIATVKRDTKASKYKNLTIDKMHDYINGFYGADTKEAAQALATFERVRSLAKIEANPYLKVANWFCTNYPEARQKLEDSATSSKEEKEN